MNDHPEKSKIDRIRDGAGMMHVGNDEDGAITGAVSVADQDLYIVKDHAVYRVFFADHIDPERTNENIPNGSQRILSVGSSSEIVSRTFLSSNTLFNCHHLDDKFNKKQIMDCSLQLLKELTAANLIAQELEAQQNDATAELKQPNNRDFAIPTVDDLDGKVKTYVQKVEHASQQVFKLIKVFYECKKEMFTGFAKEVAAKHGEDSEFSKFAHEFSEAMVFVRNLRHCIEHPSETQRLTIRDFGLTPDGVLEEPTLEILHENTPHDRIAVVSFMQQLLQMILDAHEVLMVHLAHHHMNPIKGFDVAVGVIPEEQRYTNSNVRVGYLINMGDGWQKLG